MQIPCLYDLFIIPFIIRTVLCHIMGLLIFGKVWNRLGCYPLGETVTEVIQKMFEDSFTCLLIKDILP